MSLRWPDPPARLVMATFLCVWAGAVAGRLSAWWITVGLLLVWPWRQRREVLVLSLALASGLLAGGLSHQRERQILTSVDPSGPATLVLRASTDPVRGRFGDTWFLARPLAIGGETLVPWRGPPILVSARQGSPHRAGEAVRAEGRLRPDPGWARGTPYAGRLHADRIEVISNATPGLVRLGNALRERVTASLPDSDPAAALLGGFLVGATDQLPEVDYQALRRAGLAHFVAVSGSNVAGFLILWWLVLGPLGLGRWRGILALLGLLIFVIVTRWEPSVVRAALMAGVVLGGRALGWPIDSWTALGVSGILAILVSAELVADVGFQLSILATAGILAASGAPVGGLPKWMGSTLAATLGAQVAVLPVLLITFGTVPLFAPLTNLVAAPLVAASTLVGGIGGLLGVAALTRVGQWLAGGVLWVARSAADWPQIGMVPALALTVGGWLFRKPGWRPLIALIGSAAVVWPLLTMPPAPRLTAVAIDVGQGDAILLLGATGRAVLVDGGPNPVILEEALGRYRVERVELLVVTHGDQDHAGGLVHLPGRYPLGRIWFQGPPHTTPAWEALAAAARSAGIPVEVPSSGRVEVIDGLRIEVLGPRRRYDLINNQGIVLWVDAGSTTLLLTADIEAIAQQELGTLRPEVLKVPHHGAATSDLSWLEATDPLLSIISVGENDYGHPAEEVLAALADSIIARTDLIGDMVVPLVGDPLRDLPVSSSGRSPGTGR